MERMITILRQYPILLMVLIIIPYQNIHAYQDIELLDSSDRGVTIRFTPKIEGIDTISIDHESYFKIFIYRTIFSGDPGEPMIPVKIINLGIPIESEMDVTLLSVESQDINGKLLPVPEIDSAGIYSFKPLSSTYQSSDFKPKEIIVTDPPGFVRDQRVLTIKVKTIQYSGALNRIRIFNKIILRVNFNNIRNNALQSNVVADDEFYQGVIINYPQSKKWLKPHSRNLRRVSTVLQGENWYKIFIRQDGIYKILGSDLAKMGINIDSIKPESIRIYNNGARELPQSMSVLRPDSLIENAIRVVDVNGNGKFENSDYILFYGKAVNNWESLAGANHFYQHYIHHYTNENVYWLTWDNMTDGKRMENKVSISYPELNNAANFLGLYYNEDEIYNFLNSGLDWFGRSMLGNAEQNYNIYLPHPAEQENNVFFRFRVLGVTSEVHRFTIYLNNQLLTSFSFSGNRLETHEVQKTISLLPGGYNSLKINYTGATSASQVYIDWFEIQYQAQFIAENDHLFFNQTADGPQKYRITNFQENQIEVYDITDWANVQFITNVEIASGSITFVDTSSGSLPRRYIALTSKAYLIPEKIEKTNFANLRSSISGADFIIITYDDFYEAVLPLKEHRERFDTLKTEVVKISDIFNEFAWGLYDPIAIRDFVKFAYDNWVPTPKYVLLCGDGDYDYKNIKNNLDKNWIPPYETTELNENVSRTMDEFYVLVNGGDDKPDLAIGRFPVQTVEETRNVVEKIIEYETAPFWQSNQSYPLEDWRNIVTMVADDEYHDSQSRNETMHTNDAEHIMENYIPNSFNKEKLYLIKYPAVKEPSTSGFRKPAATEALLKRLNNGTLILNFIGHGAPNIWADERVLLESRDFDQIQNKDKLPLWVAATCDFGRFDDPMEQGLAEKLFSAQRRGGMAFLTSARLAYATDNTALNREFYAQLFKNEIGSTERLGVALVRAKINNYSGVNDQKYHLFGDPTMRLATPTYPAKITSIQPGTLKALSEITVTGQIMKHNAFWDTFEGNALLKIFDSRTEQIYTTEFGSQIRYISEGKAIFRGSLHILKGQFEAKFIVPKDITYGGRYGRINIYFADQQTHGCGYQDNITVGGTSIIQDTEGPVITIGFKGQNFVNGNLVGEKSTLEVEIADSISGINIAGDIGHQITMTIDEQESDEIILTDLFNYYEGNFKAGKVLYDFLAYKRITYDKNNNRIEQYGLAPGPHTIRIKAWDNFNNSAVATASFTVISDEILKISNVFNYPNPFSSATTFTFAISQQPDQLKIKIYTIGGRLIEMLDNLPGEAGYNQVFWEGRDRDGDVLANGVYLYKIIATAQKQGKTLKDEFIGKLVVAR